MDTNLDALNQSITLQANQGKLSPNTAQSYLSSVSRVFEVATALEKADVFAVDLDELFDRFRGENGALGANTIASYESRVRAAIGAFSQHELTASSAPIAITPTVLSALTIPIRTGVVRVEGLPSDLTQSEANRIAAVVIAMAS